MRLLFNATNIHSEGSMILLEHLLIGFLAYTFPDGQKISQLLLYHNPQLNNRLKAILQALPEGEQSKVELVPCREPDALRRFIWEQVKLPKLIQQQQVDILFSFGNTGPLFPNCRQILYLQQSIPLTRYRPWRHLWPWLTFQWGYGFLINLAQIGSERIVIPTQWLVEPLRQSVVYLKPLQTYRVSLPGIPTLPQLDSIEFTPKEQNFLQQVSQWKAEGHKILLYPCDLAPYKNIPALLDAIRKISDSIPAFKLILTFNGETKAAFSCKKAVFAAVSKCPRKQVVLSGTLRRPVLTRLYQLTDTVFYPSLVESLGLPLLEALSLGLPIVALDGGLNHQATIAAFAKEVCQDAAIYAPPGKTKALAEKIKHLLNDDPLASALSQAGLKRASQFDWVAHVQAILSPEQE